MNKIVQIEDIVPIIEEQLKSGGKVSFTPRGTSMLPLFRDNVDTVILATPEFTLKKYNIVFYRQILLCLEIISYYRADIWFSNCGADKH